MNSTFYIDAYKNSNDFKSEKGEIVGGLVNHHLLAPSYIAEVVENISKSKPQTIILISPNHFDHGKASVQTADLSYQTPLGEVFPDCDDVSQISKTGLAQIDNYSFKDEHGILNILPFISKSIPQAKVVPIIVRENADYEELDKLAMELSKIPHSVVIGSFDFSHEMPRTVADFKDKKSIDAIESFDMERIKNISVDSIKGMYLTQKIFAIKGAKKFSLFQNTNSGFLENTDINDATSYITGVYKIGNESVPRRATVLMFGDMMLDRSVRDTANKKGGDILFSNLARLFVGSDIIVANLEGVFTSNDSISSANQSVLRFTFDPALISLLKKYNFFALSQANNHSNDFGEEGLKQSKALLLRNGIQTFGDYFNKDNDVVVKEIGGIKIAFIGFNEFAYRNEDKVLELIKKAHADNEKVIVMPHWGIEYERVSSDSQKKLAREFIDNGADIVVGSHPHVVEEMEMYKGKPIIYSLGNFIFDQDFLKFTAEGLGLGIVLGTNETDLYLLPFNINRSKLELKGIKDRAEFLNDLSSRSDSELSAQILKGKIILKND